MSSSGIYFSKKFLKSLDKACSLTSFSQKAEPIELIGFRLKEIQDTSLAFNKKQKIVIIENIQRVS